MDIVIITKYYQALHQFLYLLYTYYLRFVKYVFYTIKLYLISQRFTVTNVTSG